MRKDWIVIGIVIAGLSLAFSPAGAIQNPVNQEGPGHSVEVSNSKGEHIGTIKQALGDQYGNVIFAVLSIAGENEKTKDVVVPVASFSKGSDGKIILDVDRAVLASAPEFHLSDFNNPGYADQVFRHYGQTPPWVEDEAPAGNGKEK